MNSTLYYDLYGTKTLTIAELRRHVERILGVEFQERTGDHMGGDYLLADGIEDEELVIQANWRDEEDGELLEPAYSEYLILLNVDTTRRGDFIRESLSRVQGIRFLRRSEVRGGVVVDVEVT